MTDVGQIERSTQNRIIELFQRQLGYKYLGNWEDREGTNNIEETLVRQYLAKRGYNKVLIDKAIYELQTTANNYNESLYTNNKNVFPFI